MANDINPKVNFVAAPAPQPVKATQVQDVKKTDARVDSGDGGQSVAAFLSLLSGLAGNAASMGGGPYGKLLSGLTGSGAGGVSGIGGTGGVDAGYDRQMQLLQMQQDIQMQGQTWTTLTNISKTDHETRMSSIRNMRA